jgi:aryl-alcohol dehydrogenase-like predicted oxidoreductase
MKKMRHLGQTDLEVTPIGLGVWQFAGGKGMSGSYWPALPQDVADGIVKTSLDGGVNWFDTAEIYGNGQSERSLAGALKSSGKADGDVIIATKWWPFPRTASSISGTIGKRLKALGGFSIDLHQIHQPWSMSSVEAEMEEMADLVESGKIRSVGVSNFSAKRMRKAHKALSRRGLKLASNQIRYNLLYRKAERDGVFETARELGITIIAWSPLEQGVLTGKFHRDPSLLKNVGFMRKTMFGFSKRALERSLPLIETLEEIAAAHDVTPTQVTLNWVINFHGETVVAIPGASKVSHAVQNAGSMNFALSEEEMERIDRVSRRLR